MKKVSVKMILCGVALIALASAETVLAGGRGAKAQPTITICNEAAIPNVNGPNGSGLDAAVVVGADATRFLNAVAKLDDPWGEDWDAALRLFNRNRGRIVATGSCHTFKVRQGSVQVFVLLLDSLGPWDSVIETYTVEKGATLELTITLDANYNAVLTPTP